MNPHSIPLLGVPIHVLTFEQTLDRIVGLARAGRADGRGRQVATVNTDFLVNALDDHEIHRLLQQVDLAFADGMPLVWASRLLGAPLPERVAGADIVPALAERSAADGFRVLFFGGAADSAERAAALLRDRHPGADIVAATGAVSAAGDTAPDTLDHIRAAAPDVMCVGLGHPKQEHFIRRHATALGVPVAMGTGATFEFIAGDTSRAPGWMQRSGLEWLHRLSTQPARLGRRYAKDARVFGPAITADIRRARRAETAGITPVPEPVGGTVDLADRVALTRADLVALSSLATSRREHSTECLELVVTPSLRDQLAAHRIDSLFTLSLSEGPKAAHP